jgi:hypothetical protein
LPLQEIHDCVRPPSAPLVAIRGRVWYFGWAAGGF